MNWPNFWLVLIGMWCCIGLIHFLGVVANHIQKRWGTDRAALFVVVVISVLVAGISGMLLP